MFAKKKFTKKYKNIHQIYFQNVFFYSKKCFSNLLFGLQVKPKFQPVTGFHHTNYGKGSIGGTFTTNVPLVPLV